MDKIGPYEILETLHAGSQPLYRVRAPDGRVVAVKTTPVKGLTPEMRERYRREVEALQGLDHANLVRVFENGEANGVLYRVMELLDGQDLASMLAQGRKFTWDEKLSIMEQVCEALQYAHAHKLVHRDLKPANIFLEKSGRVRVLGFGMRAVAEADLTSAGTYLGTLNYMAPEQIRGEACTPATDVFSAGTVFYQLASGKHPFLTKDRSLGQVLSAIVFEDPPSLNALCPDAPEGLEFILHKAMEKDPAKRIQSADELKQALALSRITTRLGRAVATAAPIDEEKTQVMRRSQAVAPAPQPAVERPVAVPASDHPTGAYPIAPASAKPGATIPWPIREGRDALARTFRRLFGRQAYPTMPPQATIDNVHFSLTAPSHLSPGKAHEIYFWAHLESQRETVISRAMQALGLLLPKKLVMKTEGPVKVERGTELTVAVRIEGTVVRQDHKTILWTGEIGSAPFTVEVPPKPAEGTRIGFASIRVCGSEIARLDFVIDVGQGQSRRKCPVRARLKAHEKAFASYASEDRDEVLKRVQGIRKAKPDLEVFLDVMSLRAGAYWEQDLMTVIPQSDIFYLFWSRRAKASEWVGKEWHCAYDAKGLDFIDPVPLEPERLAPPPNELRMKHFDDPVLAFMGSSKRG